MTERLLDRVERYWSGNHTDSPLLLCLNHRCAVRNGVCEDDGASCSEGEDCTDCGPRELAPLHTGTKCGFLVDQFD